MILLFLFSKKKIRNLLFTVDRSTITVHGYCTRLLLVTIQKLYCNTILNPSSLLLQYNFLPIAIHFQQPLVAIHFVVLQYNSNPLHSLYCNTMQHLAIQCPSLAATPLQYTSLYCNTIFQPLSPPKLQYNTSIAIQFMANLPHIAIQLPFSCNTIAIKKISSPLSCNTIARLQ